MPHFVPEDQIPTGTYEIHILTAAPNSTKNQTNNDTRDKIYKHE